MNMFTHQIDFTLRLVNGKDVRTSEPCFLTRLGGDGELRSSSGVCGVTVCVSGMSVARRIGEGGRFSSLRLPLRVITRAFSTDSAPVPPHAFF